MVTPVEIRTGSLVLRGEMRRGGSSWVVLLHDLGQDLDAWSRLPAVLAQGGFTVLALDLRGHGGSDGEPEPQRVVEDALAAVSFGERRGASRTFLCSAGLAGSLAFGSGAAGLSVEAAVLLSPDGGIDEGDEACTHAALVVEGASEQSEFVHSARRRGGVWVAAARLPVADVGTDLLSGRWAASVEGYCTAFLQGQARMAIRRDAMLSLRAGRR